MDAISTFAILNSGQSVSTNGSNHAWHVQSVPLIIPRHMRKHAEPFDKLTTVVSEDPAVRGAAAVVGIDGVESKILGVDV